MPHCSNFPTVGGNQQIVPSAELQHHQAPPWSSAAVEHKPQDNSDRAGEEFLRCLAANKPLPDYLKGNMTFNLAEAYKSAKDMKEAVKGDPMLQKHVERNKSRSRSRGRSRGKSRAKSRARSKSRGRSRSRGRSKSRVRGKSRARSKSRPHSRSQSRHKKSHKRSKSKIRRSKSRSTSCEKSCAFEKKRKRSPDQSSNSSVCSSTNNLAGNSLLEGLKMVMNSKEYEERLPALKDAILGIQASSDIKRVESVPAEHNIKKLDCQDNATLLESDSMLLPHERVGSDFSWLKDKSQEDLSVQKVNELEDEESFLYGAEASSQNGGHVKVEKMNCSTVGGHQNRSLLSGFSNQLDPKGPQHVALSAFSSISLDNMECEKIKTILNNMGGTSDIGKTLMKTQGQQEGIDVSPALFSSETAAATLSNPNVRKALESLQSLIKATKEKRTKSNDPSQTSSDKPKAGNNEEKKRVIMRQIESLTKELEELLKHKGLSFISPVVGFYCQKCQEFIGDLNSAESHATIHQSQLDKHAKDSKGHSHHHSSSTSSQRSHSASRSDRDLHRNWKDEKDRKSTHHESRSEKGNICLKEEMKKERMLITVSRGLTPQPQTVKQENKEHGKGKEKLNSSDKSSKDKHKIEKSESSDSSEDDNSPKTKHSKKKKKKEKKKKKKRD